LYLLASNTFYWVGNNNNPVDSILSSYAETIGDYAFWALGVAIAVLLILKVKKYFSRADPGPMTREEWGASHGDRDLSYEQYKKDTDFLARHRGR
jgi:hypothetical protein